MDTWMRTFVVKQWAIDGNPLRWCSDDNEFYSSNVIAEWEGALPSTQWTQDCTSVDVWIRSYASGNICIIPGVAGCFAAHWWEWDHDRDNFYLAGGDIWINEQYYDFTPEGRAATANHEVGHQYGLHERYDDSQSGEDCHSDGDTTIMDEVVVTGDPPRVSGGCDSNFPTANDTQRVQAFYDLAPPGTPSFQRIGPGSVNWMWTDVNWAESYYVVHTLYWDGVSWQTVDTSAISSGVGRGRPTYPLRLSRLFSTTPSMQAGLYQGCIEAENEVVGTKHRQCTPSVELDVDSDADGIFNTADNCPSVSNPAQQDHGGASMGDACDDDDDGDGFTDAAELALGTNSLDNCGNPTGTPPIYSQAWPADVYASGSSANKVDISDILSFVVPVNRIGSTPGSPNYHARWDLSPGSGIAVTDLLVLVVVAPPMFGGQRAFGGPACPAQLAMGDIDCSGSVDPVDSLLIARYVSGLSVSQNEPCPDLGVLLFAGGLDLKWGDVDCSGAVDTVDELKVQRFTSGLPYSQNEPCPDIATPSPD